MPGVDHTPTISILVKTYCDRYSLEIIDQNN